MKRRKWTLGQKALIVPEGLRGRLIGELCNERGISQAQYYQWRGSGSYPLHSYPLAFVTWRVTRRKYGCQRPKTDEGGPCGPPFSLNSWGMWTLSDCTGSPVGGAGGIAFDFILLKLLNLNLEMK